jgi:hypothetical protein
MLITRKSNASGKYRTRELPIVQAQLDAYYMRGVHIQNAFPQLNDDDLEFIKTGITSEEWDAIWSDEDV